MKWFLFVLTIKSIHCAITPAIELTEKRVTLGCDFVKECINGFTWSYNLCDCVLGEVTKASCDLIQDCKENYYSDLNSCSCQPSFKTIPLCDQEQACQTGFYWDLNACSCVLLIEISCKKGLDCPDNFHWNPNVCDCVPTRGFCERLAECEDILTRWDSILCKCVGTPMTSSKRPANSTVRCIPMSCDEGFAWNFEACQCQCVAKECQQYYYWDEKTCSCRHPPCDPSGPCPDNTEWDSLLCKCVCNCPTGYSVNNNTCECTCLEKSCKTGFKFDKLACQCVKIEEPSCPPGFTYHATGSWGTKTESALG